MGAAVQFMRRYCRTVQLCETSHCVDATLKPTRKQQTGSSDRGTCWLRERCPGTRASKSSARLRGLIALLESTILHLGPIDDGAHEFRDGEF